MISLKMNLYNQFSKEIKNLINYDTEMINFCSQIENIFKGYVPIDTEKLKSTINCFYIRKEFGYIIVIEIEERELVYEEETINSIKLALKLERGQGFNGKLLKRTRDNIYAKKGTPTRDWIEKAYNQSLLLFN